MSVRIARTELGCILAAALLVISCSSSTEPTQPNPTALTHPAGNVATTHTLAGAHAIAIAPDGTMLITQIALQRIVSGQANDFSFGKIVTVSGTPVDVAITPDGKTAFVAMLDATEVAIFDVASGTVIGGLPVATSAMRALVTPDGNRVYITTTGGNVDARSTLYDFDARTFALIDTMVVGGGANGITFDADHNLLYVTAQGTSMVYEIDEAHDIVLRYRPVPFFPQDVAVSSGGALLWVATEADTSGVQIYNRATGVLERSIPSTSGAFGLKVTPDGKQLYLTRRSLGICAIINEHTQGVVKTFHTGSVPGSLPTRIAFNATGSHAIVTDGQTGAVLIQ